MSNPLEDIYKGLKNNPVNMTTPSNIELDKAIEATQSTIDDNYDSHLEGDWPSVYVNLTVETVNQLLLAAKRLKELEAKSLALSNAELLGETERCQFEAIKVRLKEVEAALAQEKVWKEEDPRMLREQMRVHDVAFQALFERSKEVEKERDEFHRCLLAREESLKREGEAWVEAKTECDTLRAEYKKALEALYAVIDTKGVSRALSGKTILLVENTLSLPSVQSALSNNGTRP